MLGYRQQATSPKISGVDTLELSTLIPAATGRYPNPGIAGFRFRNVGSAAAYVVVGAETSSAVDIPPQVSGVDGNAELAELDADNLPKLYCPANAEVYVTAFFRGPR